MEAAGLVVPQQGSRLLGSVHADRIWRWRAAVLATVVARRPAAALVLAGACAPADLEEKIPWTAVKKSWNTRRGDWVNSVNATLNCVALSKLLLHLEAALKTEAAISDSRFFM